MDQNELTDKEREGDNMIIIIDGEKLEVTKVYNYGYLPVVETDNGCEYYVAEHSEHAGEKAAEYWRDMAENDKAGFRCMVGDDSLIAWALGEYGGPGNEKTTSLEAWFQLTARYPEEQWASWDGAENDVSDCSNELVNELDFCATVAYRHN